MGRRALWILALAAACGGGGGGADGGDDGGDDAAGPDAASGVDGAGTDDRLYPLEVGRRWTYQVTSTYPSCPGGSREQMVLSEGTTEGRATFQVMSFCGLAGNTSVEGDRVEEYYDWGPTGWYRWTDEPVEDGHTWTTTNGSATFTQTYDQVGPTGGHDDCWKVIQNVSYTSYWIFCRGVGLVKYEMVDLAGGTIRADLTGTSF